MATLPEEIMNQTISKAIILAILAAISPLSQFGLGQSSGNVAKGAPLIQMESVPLSDAIRNLAAQLQLNYILDARICKGGYLAYNPPINVRWNLGVDQALQRVLAEHGLMVISNATTSVARLMATNAPVKPALVTFASSETNPAIPDLKIDTTLDKAIEEIANKVHLSVTVSPSLPVPDFTGERTAERCDLWVRWKNIRPEQALAALLDNYELVITTGPTAGTAKIMTKAEFEATGSKNAAEKRWP